MKKTYVKPQAFYESFELNANIAYGCSKKANFAENQQGCGFYVVGAGYVFLEKSICADFTPPSGKDDGTVGACYHNPTDAMKLFTS